MAQNQQRIRQRPTIPIDEPPRARNRDPDTSHVAAREIEEHLQPIQTRIVEALAAYPNGLTCREIEAKTGIEFATVTPRMRPLANAGWVTMTDQRRRVGKGGTGFVWKLNL